MNILSEYFSDFISLFYPKTCSACGDVISKGENWLCTPCILDMPKSDYWLDLNNPVNQLFWGKTKIEFASAFLLFTKGSKYRNLIHRLKYQGDQESGIKLGAFYGTSISKDSKYKTIDCIIPVPLHPKKEKKRGYNQSECIAKGLSDSLNINYSTNILIRTKDTETQTKKCKEERWDNVSGVFDVKQIEKIRNKHVLLVDDVITTGATIEHCAITLIEKAQCKVSIACLAQA